MREKGLKALTNLLAFLVLFFIAISLIVSKIVGDGSDFALLCVNISKYSAYFLVGLSSFWYAMSKRSIIIKGLWLVSVIVVVVMLIL